MCLCAFRYPKIVSSAAQRLRRLARGVSFEHDENRLFALADKAHVDTLVIGASRTVFVTRGKDAGRLELDDRSTALEIMGIIRWLFPATPPHHPAAYWCAHPKTQGAFRQPVSYVGVPEHKQHVPPTALL